MSDVQRITLLISSLRAGGAERVISLMASHWAAAGRAVTLITFSGPSEAPFYPLHEEVRLRPLGIDRASGGAARAVLNNARRLPILRAAVAESRPDAAICFLDRANVLTLLATAGLGVPVVVSERIDPRHRVLGRSWRALRLLSYPLAARVVGQTRAAVDFFPPRIRRRGAVIPNPVQRPPGADTPMPRAPGERTLLAMGRLERQKGFDMLLRAFAQVAPARPDWRLAIWGEGPLRGELEAQRDALGLAGRVRLPGLTRTPGAAMAGADLFALSSRYEGFPNVLCEAMACGLAPVSFDCPSGPRELIRDGVDGLLAPAGDEAALAAALARLMDDEGERRRLAARAPEVLERFSTTKVMELWDALLRDVTRSTSSSSSARSTTAERSAS
jgi:GalNAc-alpha-(1->4)-GalNAc-alpha-(1->3)-diNAcBac-PP-undecaprenol alpha-1,4-N-acetyl-D-galactosaminyltransferase